MCNILFIEETVKDTSNMLLSLGVIGVLILFLTVKLRVYIAEQILLVISFAFLGIGILEFFFVKQNLFIIRFFIIN